MSTPDDSRTRIALSAARRRGDSGPHGYSAVQSRSRWCGGCVTARWGGTGAADSEPATPRLTSSSARVLPCVHGRVHELDFRHDTAPPQLLPPPARRTPRHKQLPRRSPPHLFVILLRSSSDSKAALRLVFVPDIRAPLHLRCTPRLILPSAMRGAVALWSGGYALGVSQRTCGSLPGANEAYAACALAT